MASSVSSNCESCTAKKYDNDCEQISVFFSKFQQGGNASPVLMRVSLPIVDRTMCRKRYRRDRVTDRMICAGYTQGGKDSCQGDSGGPLVANDTLYGLVSWGYDCAVPIYPGVYTNVANLRRWIKWISGV